MGGLRVDDDYIVEVVNLAPKGSRPVMPQPYEAVQELGSLLSAEWLQSLSARPLWLLPMQIKVK
jgi:hypothetical protein